MKIRDILYESLLVAIFVISIIYIVNTLYTGADIMSRPLKIYNSSNSTEFTTNESFNPLELSFKYNYTDGIYTCVNFSHDAYRQLIKNNVSSLIIGYKEKGQEIGHRVIAVLIEPQTGELIPVMDLDYIRVILPEDSNTSLYWEKI